MSERHDFHARIRWTGNRGEGTRRYTGYDRNWVIDTPGKPPVAASNDPRLGGDPALHNPEDLLLSALASCHMLWYLHLASNTGIIVMAYQDAPIGQAESEPDGSGSFRAVTLRPKIEVAAGTDLAKARALHAEIHRHCFIARSVNFPVTCEPEVTESRPRD
ncbi:OsmC family protein [Pseudohoeflea sp. DP4N28-3]|uniref:OsmC family protein n=2 Tax=Pseudohoeflea coraliihabitans TaxID=2860393 RepID=A0ABS6WPM3_9HYPH|nr:OsmC family protein [Pseudohoeflea sp. DP4N28-3]